MHVVDRLDDLVHVVFHASFWQVLAAALNSFVHIHVHKLKNQREAACGLVVEYLVEGNYVGVRREAFEGLNFAKVVYLQGLRICWGLLVQCCRSALSCT